MGSPLQLPPADPCCVTLQTDCRVRHCCQCDAQHASTEEECRVGNSRSGSSQHHRLFFYVNVRALSPHRNDEGHDAKSFWSPPKTRQE